VKFSDEYFEKITNYNNKLAITAVIPHSGIQMLSLFLKKRQT